MTLKYTQAQLRTKLIEENVNGTQLYYSLVKKEGKNISFLSNQRLLVYDSNRRILFYNNDYKNTPFRDKIPEPKNNMYTPLQTSVYKNPEKTGDIQVKYQGKDSKGQLENIEWNFSCDTAQLAFEWMELLNREKDRLVHEVTGAKGSAFIHDTLVYGVGQKIKNDSNIRQTILKIDEQAQVSQKPDEFSYVEKSKIDDLNRSNLKKSQIRSPEPQSMIGSGGPVESRVSREVISTSSLKKEGKYDLQRDWNYKFLKYPNQSTLFEFQKAAKRAVEGIWQRDGGVLGDPRRVYESQGLRVAVSNLFTREATALKRQFRNYHFILESNKNKIILGVPLACLVEWQGVVALVKSIFPPQAEELRLTKTLIGEIKSLELYTRVGNPILEKGTLLDLTDIYGFNEDRRLIYVDNLIEYLPLNVDQQFQGSTLRPQYLLDNVQQVIPGGQTRSSNKQQFRLLGTICEGVNRCVKELAAYLSGQEILWIQALQLKQIFHSFGVGLKYMGKVYNQLTNKQARRYVHTVMAAKAAKDLVLEGLLQARRQGKRKHVVRIVQQSITLLIEGGNSNSSQLWKDLVLKFKKQFGMPINNAELIGGFFLNSILRLLQVKPDLSKLNKSKRIFKDEGIILPGFVGNVEPKIKSYNRFTTEFIERVRYACREQKKNQGIYEQILKTLNLPNQPIPPEYQQHGHLESILQYLSYYAPPGSIDPQSPLKNMQIYQSLNSQPPTAFSLRITRAYLKWCNKKDKGQEFKKRVDQALALADYWLDEGSIFHCELFEALSDYYASLGNSEESINFMKQSLSICNKNCGTQSKQAGSKYYELAERELRAGKKKDALQNFMKAKVNMESNQNLGLNYPLSLMRMASLHLNSGNVEGCIEQSLASIKQFQEYERRLGTSPGIVDNYKIKTFEILSRVYEITGKKNQLKQMALLCAKKFNRSKSDLVFQQMVRICLAALIFKYPEEKGQLLLGLVARITKEQGLLDSATSLRQLMGIADTVIVMEKYMNRFQNLERVIGEVSSKRSPTQDSREFLLITRHMAGCVGEDYIAGLVHQKQYE